MMQLEVLPLHKTPRGNVNNNCQFQLSLSPQCIQVFAITAKAMGSESLKLDAKHRNEIYATARQTCHESLISNVVL